MGTRLRTLFAIVGALLIVSGAVTAQSGLAVANIHTTFGGSEPTPAEMTNLSYDGSGQATSLEAVVRGSTTTIPENDLSGDDSDVTRREGVIINPNRQVANLTVQIDAGGTSGITTVYLVDNATGGDIATDSVNSGLAEFDVTLDAGKDYRVVADAGGSTYNHDYDAGVLPESGDDVDVVDGWDNGRTNGDAVNIEAVTPGVIPKTATYVSATHSASKIEGGKTNLSITNASADVAWEYHDGTAWQVANSATYTADGNHSLDLTGHSGEDNWRVNVTFSRGAGETTAALHDEAVLFDARAPDVTNQSPTDGEELSSKNPDLEVQLNDSDFGTPQSDTVQLEWFVDGSPIGSQTVSSNGTYSESTSASIGNGTHDWYVEATDSYGETASSDTWTYQAPGVLYIYNETDPDQLIDNQGEIEVSFYGNNSVITKTTSDGTVDLSGLPADEPLVVTASVDNYETRRIVIESLFEQQSIYLLNTTATSVTPTYTLNDNTGNFPPSETTLLIRLPITKDFDGDGSEETQYETVLGDQFGAVNQFSATLRPGVRYQLVVFNQEGDRRALGAHTVDDSATVSVPIGQIRETPSAGEQVAFTAGVTTQETQSGPQRYVQLTYVDPTRSTSSLQYEVVRADNESNVLIANQTESGPLGTFRLNEPIPASEPDNASYTVRYHADRDGTNDVGGNRTIGSIGEIDNTIPVDGRVLELIGFVAIVAVAGLVAIYDDALGAVSATATGIGLTWLGIVHIPSVGLAWAGVTSVVYVIVRRY